MKQILKNIITGQDMQSNELEYSLQEFIVNRMEDSEPLENIEEILKEKCDETLIEFVKDAVIDREIKLSYNQYKQGLFDGIKMALILKGKNLNVSV